MEKVTLHDLPALVQRILGSLQEVPSATIITLSGDLGAGKTTFVQALAKDLGVAEVIQSPTYVLMKSYPISFKQFTKLIHIDAYRLEHAEQFVALKPETFLGDPQNLVVIEWPERVEGALPKPDVVLKFSHTTPHHPGEDGVSEGERYIEVV